MASKKELQALITLAGKVDPSLQKALSNTVKSTKDLSEKMQQSSKHASRLGDIIKGTFIGNLAANAVSNLSSKILELGQSGIDLASGLIEVQNVVDKTFGSNANEIDTWAKTALKSFGVTELEAKNYASTLGSLMKSSGMVSDDLLLMSQNLTGLSGDWASFRNMNPEEVFEKIKAGMIGSSEPLLDLGIDTRVAALEQYALSKGINKAYNDMSQSEQMLLRYNKIMDDSKDVVGDYADTFDESLENQKRTFSKNLEQIAAKIATRFIPQLTELYIKANQFVEGIDFEDVAQKIETGFKIAGDAVAWLRDNMDWLLPVMGGVLGTIVAFSILNTVVSAFKEWKLVTEGMTLAQAILNTTMLANPLTWIAIGIGVLIAAGIALWKNWDTVKAKAIELKESFYNTFGGVIEWWSGIWNGAQSIFRGFINSCINGINKIPGVNIPLLSDKDKPNDKGVKTKPMSHYALGGIATQASIFGEAGPEMAIPLKHSTRNIGLLNQAARILNVKPYARESIKDSSNISLKLNPIINNSIKSNKESQLYEKKCENKFYFNIYGGNPSDVKKAVIEVIEEYFGDARRVSFGN